MSSLFLMITITDRRSTDGFLQLYKSHGVTVSMRTVGSGTAVQETLSTLGLEKTEKAVLLAVVTAESWQKIQKDLRRKMQIDVPGTGIAFIVPLSSIGGKRELGFLIQGQEFVREEEGTLKETKHELIVAIANYGYNTQVMKAAEEGGATGGTVLHGKGVGMKRAEQFLGVSLVSEKEVIFIVAKSKQKNAIMSAIMEKAGLTSKAGTIVFSLPVTSTAGLRILEDEEENS